MPNTARTKPATAVTQPVKTTTVPPHFELIEAAIAFREVDLGGQRVWLYRPMTEPPPSGYPLVAIGPAGSNLMTGMVLADEDSTEHLPYPRAGFAVVSYIEVETGDHFYSMLDEGIPAGIAWLNRLNAD